MKNRVKSDLAFLDMLFNMVLAFAFLFLFAFLLIKPSTETSKPAVEMKAEFVITLAWPDGAFDDQDIWVRLPDGRMLGYSLKDLGVATLDHDDRGALGNTYSDPVTGQKKLQNIRREIVTIRAIMPGRYVVNVHTFATRNDYDGMTTQVPMPYGAKVNLIKLNPRVEQIAAVEVKMEKWNDQKTAFAFTVDSSGKIVEVETDVDEPFIPTVRGVNE